MPSQLNLLSKGVIALSLISGGLISCNRKPKGTKEQASYTIGATFGRSLKAQNLDLDLDALKKGLVDAIEDKPLRLSEEEREAAMAKLSEARQVDMKKEADVNKAKAEEFLEQNRSKAGVQTTKTGLQYQILNPGQGPSPKDNDTVVVHYKGTLIDGTEFDSSHRRNQPAEFPIRGVIPGWTEGLQLMKKGGKAIIYVPPDLGYGDRPRQQIPSNAVLIFDVELLDVKSAPAQKPKK